MAVPPTVIVVGAGLAGLTAARHLQGGGHQVVVLDKGRGPGGRMATRRLDDAGQAVVDHGAQFFTVRSEAFAGIVRSWPAEVWHHGPITAASVTDDPVHANPAGDGHPRYVGTSGMNGIAKHLAEGLDVRTDVRVTRVDPVEGGWRVSSDDGAARSATAVVVTTPVPQAAELLAPPLPTDVAGRGYDPCIGLLVVLDGPSGIPSPGAVQFHDGPVNYLADNQQKGISTLPTLTVHATGPWSRDHHDDSDEAISDLLLRLTRRWLHADVVSSEVKRWRYATPTDPHPDRAVEVAPGLVLAGDVFGGPKVEGAVLSGMAAADLVSGTA